MKSKDLGQRIKNRREALQMTQEMLADKTKRDQRAISEYEAGKRRLSAVDLPVFAKALEVSVLYFFESDMTNDDFDAALLEHFGRLPTTQAKETAIEMMRLYTEAIKSHYSE